MSTVKLTIDGKEVEVPKGTRVIEAAKMADIDVPFYCYHPGLSVAGNCRMCLVEIEKMPKLQIACHMMATDGMVVNTKTTRIQETRKHVLEFLLVNHPVDCPVCDQAGECWLQDYYMRYGTHDSRLNENKLKRKKAVPLGPTVMLDQERCILCSRCVRFTDEVSKTQELGIINRGDHSEVVTFPGKELNNPYSGNVVDICPVGALTDRDFRFKVRVWYLKSEPTMCNGCSRGCNIDLQFRNVRMHHAKGERVMRLKPRFHSEINKWWMCDEGRYGYKYHDHNRLLTPWVRRAGAVEEKNWDDMLADAAARIQESGKKTGVLLSPQLSNEELFLADRLFREHLKLENVFLVSPKPEGFQDDFLIRADKNPNARGAEFLGYKYDDKKVVRFLESCARGSDCEGLIIFGQDLIDLEQMPVQESLLEKLKWVIFIGSNSNLMAQWATHVLPAATYIEKEGTFTNFEGRIQKFSRILDPLGDAMPEWEMLIRLSRLLGLESGWQDAADIFDAMAAKLEPFKGLSHASLEPGSPDLRKFAAPMIPQLVQRADLIFEQKQVAGFIPESTPPERQ